MARLKRVKYQTDKGSVFNLIVQDSPDIDTFIAPQVTAALTENFTVRVSKNEREVGIKPRYILLGREVGAGTADANCLVQTGLRYKAVAIPTLTRWDAIVEDSTISINGQDYKVRKKIAESLA